MANKNINDTFYVAGGNTKIVIDKDNLTTAYDKKTEELIITYPCKAIARIPLNVRINDGTTKTKQDAIFNIDVCCDDQKKEIKKCYLKNFQ